MFQLFVQPLHMGWVLYDAIVASQVQVCGGFQIFEFGAFPRRPFDRIYQAAQVELIQYLEERFNIAGLRVW